MQLSKLVIIDIIILQRKTILKLEKKLNDTKIIDKKKWKKRTLFKFPWNDIILNLKEERDIFKNHCFFYTSWYFFVFQYNRWLHSDTIIHVQAVSPKRRDNRLERVLTYNYRIF